MLEDRIDLIASHTGEPLEKLSNCGAAFEILEERAHGDASGPEQPFAADLSGHSFDNWTLTPIEH